MATERPRSSSLFTYRVSRSAPAASSRSAIASMSGIDLSQGRGSAPPLAPGRHSGRWALESGFTRRASSPAGPGTRTSARIVDSATAPGPRGPRPTATAWSGPRTGYPPRAATGREAARAPARPRRGASPCVLPAEHPCLTGCVDIERGERIDTQREEIQGRSDQPFLRKAFRHDPAERLDVEAWLRGTMAEKAYG